MKYLFPLLIHGHLLWPGIPAHVVLVFHHLGPKPRKSNQPGQYHTLQAVHSAMIQLKGHGYRPAGLDELPGAPESQRLFALTFDDGYASGLEDLLGLLEKHRVPATQFLVAGRIGETNHWDEAKGEPTARLMDRGQIRRWLDAGHAIGAHSVSHPNLRHLDGGVARSEIGESRRLLEQEFQKPVRHFAYPYGSHGSREENWVRESGYSAGWSLGPHPGSNPWACSRWSPRTPAMLAGFLSNLGGNRR